MASEIPVSDAFASLPSSSDEIEMVVVDATCPSAVGDSDGDLLGDVLGETDG